LRRLTLGAFLALVLALVVLGGLGLSGAPAPLARGPVAATAPVARAGEAAQPAVTHGDLVVTSGERFVIAPPELNQTYYQGGNITVEAGGTLIVRNTTISFVQFIPEYGTVAARVLDLYSFNVAGTADFFNSTITTDTAVLNAYPKLPLTVTGTMTLWNSTLSFPGWISVTGAGADLTLNNSAITANPAILSDTPRLPYAIQKDTQYAADYTQSAGAHASLFGSTYQDTYADPIPPPLNASFDPSFWSYTTPIQNGNFSFPGFSQDEPGSAALAQALLYPSGYSGGVVEATYDSNGTGIGTATASLYFQGTTYPVGTLTFASDQLDAVASVPIPAPVITAINSVGRTSLLSNPVSIILSGGRQALGERHEPQCLALPRLDQLQPRGDGSGHVARHRRHLD